MRGCFNVEERLCRSFACFHLTRLVNATDEHFMVWLHFLWLFCHSPMLAWVPRAIGQDVAEQGSSTGPQSHYNGRILPSIPCMGLDDRVIYTQKINENGRPRGRASRFTSG